MYTHLLHSMRLFSRGVDEYTLAAYLSGRLAPSRRREVAEFLSRNDEARDLLYAAGQLLDAEGDGHGSRRPTLSIVDLPPKRRPLLTPSRRLSVLLWTTVVLVCVTAFSTTVLVAYRAGVDSGASRLGPIQVDPGTAVSVQGQFGGIAWEEVPRAASYRVVIWDDEGATMVAGIPSEVAFVDYATISSHLAAASEPRVWVDAYDAEGDLMLRTRSMTFQH